MNRSPSTMATTVDTIPGIIKAVSYTHLDAADE